MNLSIIIPVYNAEKYLDDCLQSVFSSGSGNFEVILIDDGSTDGSSKIYQKYSTQNLICIRNENHGVSYSRNVGISKSRGKWIMFLDADDILKKGWEKIISAYYESNFDIVFFSGQPNFHDIDKTIALECILGVNSRYKFMPFPCSRMFKREFIKKNGIQFDADIMNGEDLLFNVEAFLKAEQVHYENLGIYYYRNNIYSVTQTFNENIFISDQCFHKKLEKILTLTDIVKKEYYLEYLRKNAIYLFVHKIAMLQEQAQRKKYYYIFSEKEYNSLLSKREKIHSFKEFILFLISKNKIDLSIFIIVVKEKIKRFVRFRKRENLLELV